MLHQLKPQNAILMIRSDADTSFLGIPESLWSHAILPFAIPFLLLGIGYFINLTLVKWHLRRQLISKQQFLFTWIDLIGPQLHAQARELNDLVPEVLRFESQLLAFNVLPVHLDKLQLVNSVDLISLFITNKQGQTPYKTQLLFTLENSIDYLKAKTVRSLELIDVFVADMQETDKAIEEILKELGSSLNKIDTQLTTAKGYSKLIRRYRDWQLDNNSTIGHFKVEHFDGILRACKRITEIPGQKGGEVLEVRNILHRVNNLYDTKQRKREKYASIFKDKAVELHERYEELLRAKNALNTLRFRFFMVLK